MEIKNRLKAIREQKNISQKELAEILKINVYTVSKWETGVRTPDEKHLEQIAQALCV
jgi:transcriptional regulator with XRE-family HTH domain